MRKRSSMAAPSTQVGVSCTIASGSTADVNPACIHDPTAFLLMLAHDYPPLKLLSAVQGCPVSQQIYLLATTKTSDQVSV